MKILALDTSSAACSVALLSDDSLIQRHEILPQQQANSILSFIDEMLGADRDSLTALAWGCGPGSFTGLRIGASVIQALGFSLNLPIINISSLAALAQSAYQQWGFKRLLVAVDARMNEIYWGHYAINEEGIAELVGKELLITPQALDSKLKNCQEWEAGSSRALDPALKAARDDGLFAQQQREALLLGSAWSIYQAELEDYLKEVEPARIEVNCLPTAAAVAYLGRRAYDQGLYGPASNALPTYLRDNVCKLA